MAGSKRKWQLWRSLSSAAKTLRALVSPAAATKFWRAKLHQRGEAVAGERQSGSLLPVSGGASSRYEVIICAGIASASARAKVKMTGGELAKSAK